MAIENFKKAINIEPNNSRYIINLANHFRESNRTIQAINLLKDFNKSTTDINVLILLVGLQRDIQKHEEAIEYCSEAIKIEKENSYLILILATLFLESNNVVEAEKFFELSLKYRPFFGPALKMLSLFKKIVDDSILEFHKNKRVVQTASFLQVRRPLFKSSIDSWKKYKDEIGYLNN